MTRTFRRALAVHMGNADPGPARKRRGGSVANGLLLLLVGFILGCGAGALLFGAP